MKYREETVLAKGWVIIGTSLVPDYITINYKDGTKRRENRPVSGISFLTNFNGSSDYSSDPFQAAVFQSEEEAKKRLAKIQSKKCPAKILNLSNIKRKTVILDDRIINVPAFVRRWGTWVFYTKLGALEYERSHAGEELAQAFIRMGMFKRKIEELDGLIAEEKQRADGNEIKFSPISTELAQGVAP
jgi:hypothetical protein